MQRLESQEIDEGGILSLSAALEQSYIESEYAEVVNSNDAEFRSLMREIKEDTVFRREYLQSKTREWAS